MGSAVQNIITLTDSVFLYHVGEVDFAAIGFVGVFYMTIAAIGFGFSKGGQIIIARRVGAGQLSEIGPTFNRMLLFELILALVFFIFMQLAVPWLFGLFINSPEVYSKSLEYLDFRAWGVFASYIGVSVVALYAGLARTMVIVWNALALALTNLLLNYTLIFGHFGFEEMGIGGAGLASTVAEYVALFGFMTYILLDKKNKTLSNFFNACSFDGELKTAIEFVAADSSTSHCGHWQLVCLF